MGLTVIGGRESSVGVGGLTLGGKSRIPASTASGVDSRGFAGGMSFYSGMYGFACDNVAMYEVR